MTSPRLKLIITCLLAGAMLAGAVAAGSAGQDMETKKLPLAARKRFRCRACDTMMGHGNRRCDRCDEQAPVCHLPGFWLGLRAFVGLTVLTGPALVILR